ncbi:MAG: DUF4832 domain-containing protein, partial [Acidobacteriota bacterium]
AVSAAALTSFTPGGHTTVDDLAVPGTLAPGTYGLEVAVLAPARDGPAVDLAIEGRTSDGWYRVSDLEVR